MTEILPPKTNEYPLNIIFLCLKMIPFPFEFCSLFWGAKFLHFQWGKVTKVPQREGENPTTLRPEIGSDIQIYPIGSMGLVYLPTFTYENQPNVGEYTSQMDPMGYIHGNFLLVNHSSCS